MFANRVPKYSRIGGIVLASIVIGACATPSNRSSQAASIAPSAVVANYLAALNRRDLLMLTAYVAPDVEWYSVVRGKLQLEVSGREDLARSLKLYFEQNEATHWTVEASTAVDGYVALRERSDWRQNNHAGQRVSLGVYEIRDGRIARITYFLDAP